MKLVLKEKLISLHSKMKVFNEEDDVVYTISSAPVSLTDKTHIKNADGDDIAYIHKKPISIHQLYTVELVGQEPFEMSTELFHLIKDVITIPSLEWTIQGNLMEHDYQIFDENEQLVASTHKRWLAVHHIYEIDVKQENHVDKVVAIYATLEHILSTRAAVRSSTSHSQ